MNDCQNMRLTRQPRPLSIAELWEVLEAHLRASLANAAARKILETRITISLARRTAAKLARNDK